MALNSFDWSLWRTLVAVTITAAVVTMKNTDKS